MNRKMDSNTPSEINQNGRVIHTENALHDKERKSRNVSFEESDKLESEGRSRVSLVEFDSDAEEETEERELRPEEEAFLSSIENGEISVFMDMLYRKDELHLDINCRDSNGESALKLAIAKGYSGVTELLLKHGARVGDALLRAVDVGFVETVKKICDYATNLQASEARYAILDCHCEDDDYHPDITPIVLAAQRNEFTIVKILTDAGCKIKVASSKTKQDSSAATDDLQKSVGSLELYKGLASEAYLTQANEDPVETSFKLSKKLRQLGQRDVEFKTSYMELADNVDQVGTELISHARNTEEILTVLTYYEGRANGKDGENGKAGPLPKISKAIAFEQKSFVAHPNCQQAILAQFYGRLAFLRDKHSAYRLLIFLSMLVLFPFLSLLSLYVQKESFRKYLRCPYNKFVMKLASDLLFVVLLIADTVIHSEIEDELALRRPTKVLLFVWVIGIAWREIKTFQMQGAYVLTQASHWRDIVLVVLFLLGIAFDIVGYYYNTANMTESVTSESRRDIFFVPAYEDMKVNRLDRRDADYIQPPDISDTALFQEPVLLHRVARQARRPQGGDTNDGGTTTRNITDEELLKFIAHSWWHPKLLSISMFAISAVVSFLRMLPYVVISDVIGPLQISLGSMVTQTAHFFLVAVVVLVSFAVGMTYIYSYYDQTNALTCAGDTAVACNDGKFINLFWGIVYLYWSALGFEDQTPLLLNNQAQVLEAAGLVLYAMFYILMIIVLLNALIAVMSEVYNSVEENADVEWKFHSTVMWMSILLDDDVVPPPFNLLPSAEDLKHFCAKCHSLGKTQKRQDNTLAKKKEQETGENQPGGQDARSQYKRVLHKLVERYVMAKTAGELSVNADVTITDILGLRNDLQSLKMELFQRLFETKHNIDTTTDEGSAVRDTSITAKSVLHKAEEIHDNVDADLLQSVINFKSSVDKQKASLMDRIREKSKGSDSIFTQLVGTYEAAKARIGFSSESPNDASAAESDEVPPSKDEADGSTQVRKDQGPEQEGRRPANLFLSK